MHTVEALPVACCTRAWCGCLLYILLKKALLDDHKVRWLQHYVL
jgi:hypothetical protein